MFIRRAWEIVKPMIGVKHEALPLATAAGDYLMVHFTEHLDCLDQKASECELYPDGSVFAVKTYAFRESKLKGQHFFAVPETAGVEVLVSEDFRALFSGHKLAGAIFEELKVAKGRPNGGLVRQDKPRRRSKLIRDNDLPNCFLVRIAATQTRKLKSADDVEELLTAAEKDRPRVLRLDEAWEMVSFLNNSTVAVPMYKTGFKSQDPGEWALLGGRPLPWPDSGSEPARLITAGETVKIAKELARFSKRLDSLTPKEIGTVHHEYWNDFVAGEFGYIGLQTNDQNKHWKYVLKHFRRLRDFYQAAAEAKQAILIYAEPYEE